MMRILKGKGRWGKEFLVNARRSIVFCFLVLNWTRMMRKVTCAIHLKFLLLLWMMKCIFPSTVYQKTSYLVDNVWKQIQGQFPCHNSVLGVLPQGVCLWKSLKIVRVNGKTYRRSWTQMMAPLCGYHFVWEE